MGGGQVTVSCAAVGVEATRQVMDLPPYLLLLGLRSLNASARSSHSDKAPTYGKAIAVLKRAGKLPITLEHRQIKYHNNSV
jgi:transposase-like protein